MLGNEFDITKNIRTTQQLQCELLAAVSQLFQAVHTNSTKTEKAEVLARIEILTQLISQRMGVSTDMRNQKAVSQIKLGLLDEDKSEWKTGLLHILREMEQ